MGATLFVGYTPSFQGLPQWKPTFRQSRAGTNGGIVRRTVWLHASGEHYRLIVDVGEYRREVDVAYALESATREAGAFRPGPDWLGGRSLAAEDPVTPSIYVTRANLLIWAVSNGGKRLDVEPVLKNIIDELDRDLPQTLDEDLKFRREHGEPTPGAVNLSFDSPWTRGERAWMKFTAHAATLERAPESDRLLVQPTGRDGSFSVTGWVIEPGRQTYLGRYRS